MPVLSSMEINREEASKLVGTDEVRWQLQENPGRQFRLLTGVDFIRFWDQGWRYLVVGKPDQVAATAAWLN